MSHLEAKRGSSNGGFFSASRLGQARQFSLPQRMNGCQFDPRTGAGWGRNIGHIDMRGVHAARPVGRLAKVSAGRLRRQQNRRHSGAAKAEPGIHFDPWQLVRRSDRRAARDSVISLERRGSSHATLTPCPLPPAGEGSDRRCARDSVIQWGGVRSSHATLTPCPLPPAGEGE